MFATEALTEVLKKIAKIDSYDGELAELACHILSIAVLNACCSISYIFSGLIAYFLSSISCVLF